MSLTAEQKLLRRTGVGSSDVAAILGVSPFRSPFDVWLSKVEGFEPEGNFSQELGDLLEPVVLALYERRAEPAKLVRGAEIGTLVHPWHSWVLDTPDALAHFANGEVRAVEAKAPRWRSDDWGDDGSDGIEEHYIVQSLWHMAMQRAHGLMVSRCDVPVLFGASEFRIYAVEWDEEFAALLFDRVGAWWHQHVVARVPPSMDDSRNAAAWLKQKFRQSRPELLEATPDDELLAWELRAATQACDQAEQRFADLSNRMKARIGEAAGVQTALGAITWKSDKNGKRTFRVPKQWRKSDGE